MFSSLNGRRARDFTQRAPSLQRACNPIADNRVAHEMDEAKEASNQNRRRTNRTEYVQDFVFGFALIARNSLDFVELDGHRVGNHRGQAKGAIQHDAEADKSHPINLEKIHVYFLLINKTK